MQRIITRFSSTLIGLVGAEIKIPELTTCILLTAERAFCFVLHNTVRVSCRYKELSCRALQDWQVDSKCRCAAASKTPILHQRNVELLADVLVWQAFRS